MKDNVIGQYQIVAELGRGGMAVVYRAWQPSLARYVALKVLPAYFQHEAEFLARFQREATAAARLTHPNIVSIFDVGEQAGVHYIAMECLDGGSLQNRLIAGPMRLEDAARILEQVASALDYAHRQGIIHRDIKPANIMFTDDGWPKVGDFGIARPDEGTRLTRTGVLMGTPEYMSPEQAMGTGVDRRSDLYALGVVLYEMVTGRVPFEGATPHATLHAVIYEAPPPPRQLNPSLPPAIETVVLKAIAKDADRRFQSGAEMAAALRQALAGVRVTAPATTRQVAAPAPRPEGPRTLRNLVIAVVAVAAVLVGLITWLLASGGTHKPRVTVEADYAATQAALVPAGGDRTATAVSQAGLQASSEALRATDAALRATTQALDGRQATGTAGARAQATATEGAVRQQSTATALAEKTRPADATTQVPPIQQRATDTPTATWTPSPTPSPTRSPTPSPTPSPPAPETNGRIAFYTARNGKWEVYVMNADGSGQTNVSNNPADDWQPAWSPNGDRLAFVSNRDGTGQIYVMNADGGGQRNLSNYPARDWAPAWSSTGQIAFESQRDGNWELYVMNAAGGGATRLTNNGADEMDPSWSPDGNRIAFYSTRTGNAEIYVINAGGGGLVRLTDSPADDWHPAWSPDGTRIVFQSNRDGNWNLYVMNSDGSGLARLTDSPADDQNPAWSPNGRQIVFSSKRSGNGDIYVLNLSGGTITRLTKNSALDDWPVWSP